MGSITAPALVDTLGFTIFKWAVLGMNVAPTGALIEAYEKTPPINYPHTLYLLVCIYLKVRHAGEGEGHVGHLVSPQLVVLVRVKY